MWPTISNIDSTIAEKIKSYPNNLLKASELNAWVRVFSGAERDGYKGLIMESNTNWKLFNAAGEGGGSIYGNPQQSGTLGRDWEGKAVNAGVGRGLRPSPIITSLNSKEGKDQISRTCDFSITCFSLEQLEYMQSYFMEPGYSVGVEWGWNTINGVSGLIPTGTVDGVLNGIADTTLNNGELSEKRLKTLGEYDVFLGFIVGSTVSNDGENFKIDVRLRGAPSLPTYLQSHTGTNEINDNGVIINNKKSTDLYKETETLSNDLAKRRFGYMFNELPAFRQTDDVKKLEDTVVATQFINFDKVIENEINQGVTAGLFRSNTIEIKQGEASVEIESGKLFSQNRYIKMDLAINILNSIGTVNKYSIGNKKITFKIEIDNSIIGGFPYMFSTKADKLVIPGTLPDFLQYFLQLGTIEQDSGGSNGGGFLKINGKIKGPEKAKDGIESFVWGTKLNKFGLKEKEEYYGYLKDLYVNFDMFKAKLEQKNKNVREILLDILNEMSSAVNGFWNFQIVEGEFQKSGEQLAKELRDTAPYVAAAEKRQSGIPPQTNLLINLLNISQPTSATGGSDVTNATTNKTATHADMQSGDVVITVIDENWIGENPDTGNLVEFKHNGNETPFLNSTLDISIPADTANQIILKRLNAVSQPELPDIAVGEKSLFNSNTDLFLKKTQIKSDVDDDVKGAPTEPDTSDVIKKLEDNIAAEDAKIVKTERLSSGRAGSSATFKDKDGNIIKSEYRNANNKLTTTYTKKSVQADFIQLGNEKIKQNEAAVNSLSAFLDKLDIVPLSNKSTLGGVESSQFFEKLTTFFTGGAFTDKDNLAIDKIRNNFASYCFDDTEYFNRLKNDAFATKYGKDTPGGLSHPLPIKYTFTILGNSGIRRGDTFNIDGIPEKYKKSGLFQVTEIEHTLSDMKWTTTITGQYRQIQ